jgi:hypothetical protein
MRSFNRVIIDTHESESYRTIYVVDASIMISNLILDIKPGYTFPGRNLYYPDNAVMRSCNSNTFTMFTPFQFLIVARALRRGDL